MLLSLFVSYYEMYSSLIVTHLTTCLYIFLSLQQCLSPSGNSHLVSVKKGLNLLQNQVAK